MEIALATVAAQAVQRAPNRPPLEHCGRKCRSAAEEMRSTCRCASSANAASDRRSAYSRKSCWSVNWFTHGRVAAAAKIGQGTRKPSRFYEGQTSFTCGYDRI